MIIPRMINPQQSAPGSSIMNQSIVGIFGPPVINFAKPRGAGLITPLLLAEPVAYPPEHGMPGRVRRGWQVDGCCWLLPHG